MNLTKLSPGKALVVAAAATAVTMVALPDGPLAGDARPVIAFRDDGPVLRRCVIGKHVLSAGLRPMPVGWIYPTDAEFDEWLAGQPETGDLQVWLAARQ